MSILIKGMEMPKDIEPGLVIEFADGIDGKRYARLYHYRHGGLTEWLEAIPIQPHGRLIDADAPIKVWEVRLSDGDSCSFRNIETTVSTFLLSHLIGEVPPTIIPADKEGE